MGMLLAAAQGPALPSSSTPAGASPSSGTHPIQATLVDLGLGVGYALPPRVHQLVGGVTCQFFRNTAPPAPSTSKGGGKRTRGSVGGGEVFCLLDLPLLLPIELHPTSKRQDFLPKVVSLF